MKKIVLSVLLLGFLSPFNLFSQENQLNKLGFGFTVAPQFTQISSPGLPAAPESGVGYLAGIFGEYQVLNSFKVRVGANYDKRCFTTRYLSNFLVFQDTIVSYKSYFEYDLKYSMDYFTIPISFIYKKGEGPFKLFIQGTFYYSFYLTAHKNGFTNTHISQEDFKYIDHEEHPNIKEGDNRDDYNGASDIFLANERFNTSDIGINFFIGGIYQLSEKVGIYLSPGFTASFGRILENPIYDAKWIRIFKIETGIVIHLNK